MALTRFPPLTRALTRRAGSSMVVVTEYRFDAARWRAAAGEGPKVTAVEVGTAGHDWSPLPIAPGPLQLDPEGPPGRPPDHVRARPRAAFLKRDSPSLEFAACS